jgi:hypothetical protein
MRFPTCFANKRFWSASLLSEQWAEVIARHRKRTAALHCTAKWRQVAASPKPAFPPFGSHFVTAKFCGLTHGVTRLVLLTPWSWALVEKPIVAQLLKNVLIFYGTQRFVTRIMRTHYRTQSWARTIQSIPTNHTYLGLFYQWPHIDI